MISIQLSVFFALTLACGIARAEQPTPAPIDFAGLEISVQNRAFPGEAEIVFQEISATRTTAGKKKVEWIYRPSTLPRPSTSHRQVGEVTPVYLLFRDLSIRNGALMGMFRQGVPVTNEYGVANARGEFSDYVEWRVFLDPRTGKEISIAADTCQKDSDCELIVTGCGVCGCCGESPRAVVSKAQKAADDRVRNASASMPPRNAPPACSPCPQQTLVDIERGERIRQMRAVCNAQHCSVR